MEKLKTRASRLRRHHRVRLKIAGDGARPRLAVFRSLNHIYAQLIDDSQGHTLLAASTLDPEVKQGVDGKPRKTQAELVGMALAKKALAKGIKEVVFDRGGYRYHGRVKALAEGARQGGLKF